MTGARMGCGINGIIIIFLTWNGFTGACLEMENRAVEREENCPLLK